MRRLIVVLIIGLVVGYRWGYGEGEAGKGTFAERTWERFGTSKIKAAQEERERRVQDASKP